MIVIGLFGKMGSGKGIASAILKDAFDFTSLGITDPIKQLLKDFLNVPSYKLWGNSEERTEDVRKALQDFGACGRAQKKDIWLKHLILNIEKNRKWTQGERIVVDDLRYLDEAEELKRRYKATLIQIECPSSYSCVSDPKLREHESEKALEDVNLNLLMDYVIVNDSSLEVFREKVVSLMKDILHENT